MTLLPLDGPAVARSQTSPPVSGLERVLRGISVFTLLMTVPQVLTIWVGRDAHSVSLTSWAAYLLAASLWFVYGLRKHDKTIYLACVGWILLDAAIVIGIVIYGLSNQLRFRHSSLSLPLKRSTCSTADVAEGVAPFAHAHF